MENSEIDLENSEVNLESHSHRVRSHDVLPACFRFLGFDHRVADCRTKSLCTFIAHRVAISPPRADVRCIAGRPGLCSGR